MATEHDAIVIGSGPNGLVAAITMARAGRRVLVLEAAATPGGGCRTAELTAPGFRHDVCSTVLALGLGSPALRRLPLADHGLLWLHPEIALAHPLDGGAAAFLHHSLDDTAAGLAGDGPAWRRLMAPLVGGGLGLVGDLLSPLAVPRHPLRLARFAPAGLRGGEQLARRRLATEEGRALLAGLAAHSELALHRTMSAGVGLVLGALAHIAGWPFAKGGSQALVDALVAILAEHGGEVVCGQRVDDLAALPPAPIVLADVSPRQLAAMAGDRLPDRTRRRWSRFRPGPGVFKLDYALSEPVPWRNPAVARAGTVHVAGPLSDVVESEAAMAAGRHAERPFIIAAQPTACDASRAPVGRHVLWSYCHVPPGSTVDMTDVVERQLERFAPGFRDVVIARHRMSPADFEAYNPNLIGGDISGGVADWRQFVARPALGLHPWRTPIPGVYLCSSSTPPGGGVHGMCGHHAATLALRDHPD